MTMEEGLAGDFSQTVAVARKVQVWEARGAERNKPRTATTDESAGRGQASKECRKGLVKSLRIKSLKSSSAKKKLAESTTPKRTTFAHQHKLPKLPIPALDDTCARFLNTVAPMLDATEMEATRVAVQQFRENDGPKVQALLEEYDKGEENYVDRFWDDAYLLMDDPVVVNVNPFFVLEDDPTGERNIQSARAANLVFSMCKFVHAIRTETLQPDEVRGVPLCMAQYKTLLGSARIPHGSGPGRDSIVNKSDSTHIVVVCRNQFYVVDVVSPRGELTTTVDLLRACLESILDDADLEEDAKVADEAIGVLTTETRTTWARYRNEIEQVSSENAAALKAIDEAIFVLCLDQLAPVVENALRGSSCISNDGVEVGTCMSRWYDKLQLIVQADGRASVCFEHTPADGHTVLRMMSDVITDNLVRFAQSISGNQSVSNHLKSVRLTQKPIEPSKLYFSLTESIQAGIQQAHVNLLKVIDAQKIIGFEFRGFGKSFITSKNLSPDAFVQQCMMAAVFKVTSKPVNTYESVMTKGFLRGRTEAGRSLTSEAKAFVEAFRDPEAPAARKEELLRRAAKAHSAMTSLASKGQGVDRHLYALKCMWHKALPNDPLPQLFSCPGYQKLGVTILSTSNCGNPALKLFGFGPVSKDGIGIGYVIKNRSISFSLCSKTIPITEVADELSDVLNELQSLLRHTSKRKSIAARVKRFVAR
mmetsp:Transcript_9705/g.17087  ORF Transcript_9705/g.17087 Transcript_9705/m.17087 type:complete len:705 (+) Transcript_9705:168-2282(+)